MPYVINITPFQAQAIEFRFYNGHLYDCLFLKATFKLTHDGQLKPLVQQPGFVISDEYELPQEATFEHHPALRYPSDLTPYKPTTDVLVMGQAKPAAGQPRSRWNARLQIQGQLDKRIQLTGPRHWQHTLLGGWQLEPLQETSAVRLSYSLATGGGSQGERTQERDIYPPNPFGRGYLGRDKPDRQQLYPAPQILHPTQGDPVWGRPDLPTGLSALDGLQMARLQHAGTYDEHWHKHVAPNIPLDMNLAFWNTAPEDQLVHPYLVGGERVHTEGLFPTDDGKQDFFLPHPDVFVVPVRLGQKHRAWDMHLDTVIIDLDTRHVILRWCTLISRTHGFDEYQVVAYPEPSPARREVVR